MLYQRQNQYTLVNHATETFYTKLYILHICIFVYVLDGCVYVSCGHIFSTLSNSLLTKPKIEQDPNI